MRGGAGKPMADLEDILSARDALGVLRRDHEARVLNVSGSGCLVETTSEIEPGTMAFMVVSVNGQEYSDSIRIVRCQRVPGGSSCQLGAEFIWTTQPGARSLRRIANALPVGEPDVMATVQVRGRAASGRAATG
jgi:hypothetical protein